MAEILDNIETNENLKNTLTIEGTAYNINAVRSVTAETADKTQKSLVIKESGVKQRGDDDKGFDGSIEREIDYVNATKGGMFFGPVHINDTTGDLLDVNDLAVLNYKQIKSKLAQLTGSPLYTWDVDSGYHLRSLVDTATGTFGRLNTIVGTSADFEELKVFLEKTASTGLEFYKNSNGTLSVSGLGTCTDKDIIIPDYVEWEENGETTTKPVVSIRSRVFNPQSTQSPNNAGNAEIAKRLNEINSVVIPHGITSIGESAFKNCSNLTSVIMASSVATIGAQAFTACSKLQKVVLGAGLITIGDNVFQQCSSLKTITIPSSVSSIGSTAFNECKKLEYLVIPEGTTIINSSTFSWCYDATNQTGLKTVVIPASVTEIKSNAFLNCVLLNSIIFSGTAEQWKAITKYNDGQSGNSAWNQSTGNYYVYCTDKVLDKSGNSTTEYTLAFTLNDDKISYSVTSVSNKAVSHSTIPKLHENLPITNIGSRTFSDYTKLTSVAIPISVKKISADAFTGCTNLANIYYDGSEDDWNNLIIESGNDCLLNANLISKVTITPVGSIKVQDLALGPCLYVCKDAESDTAPASNKVFLKLPGKDFIEISKGAARLERSDSTKVDGYYTYDTLAEIIAKINKRLEALGSEEIKISTPAFAPIPDTGEVDTDFDPTAIPTVQELKANKQNKVTVVDSENALPDAESYEIGDLIIVVAPDEE